MQILPSCRSDNDLTLNVRILKLWNPADWPVYPAHAEDGKTKKKLGGKKKWKK